MRRFVSLSLASLALAVFAPPAYARDHGRGWDDHGHRHYRHGPAPSVYVGNFFPPRPVMQRTYIVNNSYYQPAPQPYRVSEERYCREYYGPVRIGGRVQQAYGNACLQPDGSWEVVD